MADELDTASAVQQYLRGPDVATQARASMAQAAGTSGALEAELRAVSARTGVPISTARAMPQEVKRRAAAADDYEDLTRRFPNTMGFLANADNARLAHDDRDNLTALERVMQEGSFIGRALASSMPALSEGIGGVAQGLLESAAPLLDDMVGKILPANPLRAVAAEINKTRLQAGALAKGVAGELPPDAGNFRRGVQSGFQSLGSQAPAIVASVLTRDPRYMLGSAGVSEGGKSYGAARDKGMSPLGSAIYGGSQAFVEVATESLPALALLKDLKVGSSLFKTILHQAAAEIPGEQLATLAQDYNEWLFLNPDKPFKSYLDARPDAAIQTLVATVVATGAQAAIGHTAAKMGGTMGKPEEPPGPSLVQRIVETANNSELRKRDPNAFASLVQQTADANGAPAEVFIDARQVSEALQQSGITLEQAVAAMPSLADQLEAATVMGGDVVIPIGEFAAGIAGSPIEPLLMQHVRTEADGLSQADGKKKTAADQQMAGTAKKAEEQAANLTPLEKEREKVKQDILEQLNATKRFTPDIHEAQAELTATVLSNIARRAGKTIEQLFNGKPLKVQASGVFADALQSSLAQEAVTMSAAFQNWFGDSKVVDAKGKPLVVYHGAPDARFVKDDGIFKTIGEKYGMSEPGKRAFWFTPDRRVANTYADDRRAFDYQNAESGIVDAYLNLQNPLIVDGGGKEWRNAQARGKTSDVIEQARAGGHDGVIIRNVRDDYNNTPRTRPTDTYVVFSSNQIKSATGNNGDFDPANPSILKQDAPARPSPGHIEAMKREKVLNRLLECLSG